MTIGSADTNNNSGEMRWPLGAVSGGKPRGREEE